LSTGGGPLRVESRIRAWLRLPVVVSIALGVRFRFADLVKKVYPGDDIDNYNGGRTLSPARSILLLTPIILLGFLERMYVAGAGRTTDDMAEFVGWFESALAYPPSQLYAHSSLNYPPGYAFILVLTAQVYHSLVHGGHDSALIRMLIELPAIAFDLVGAVVAYVLVGRFATPPVALAAAAYFAFDPAFIYISAYWGQLDSIPAVSALAAVLLLLSGIAALAWPLLAFAALVKPPVSLLALLFLLYPFAAQSALERKRRFLGAAIGIALALTLTEALAFMFFPHPTAVAPTRQLIKELHRDSSLYTYTSLNAFNFWSIFQDFFASDRVRWGPLIMKHWAQALFVVVAALICGTYAWRRSATSFLEAAVLLFLAFFLFMPEMHERYQSYATMFAGALVFRRPYAIAAAVLSITMLLSMEYALMYLALTKVHITTVDIDMFAPCLVRLCALANLGIFVWLAGDYLSPLARSLARSLGDAAPTRRAEFPRGEAGDSG